MKPEVIEPDPSDGFDALFIEAVRIGSQPNASRADRALMDLALAMKADLDRRKKVVADSRKGPLGFLRDLWRVLRGRKR